MANKSPSTDRELLLELAEQSGKIALKYFNARNEVRYKNGNSPVSEADDEIDEYLRTSFAKARPDYGWLSEETDDNTERLSQQRVVIVDPIDGTRGFIEGKNEWCISIAIVENARPVEAILHCPMVDRTFVASQGEGMELIGTQPQGGEGNDKLRLTGSQKIITQLQDLNDSTLNIMEFIPSLAYRIALVAINELDGAFARAGASEWDLAAADLILTEAGGKLTNQNGDKVLYNQKSVVQRSLIAGTKERHDDVMTFAKQTRIVTPS